MVSPLTSGPAYAPVETTGKRTVSVLAYDGMTAFETGIATEIFGLTWPDIGAEWYDLRVCTEKPEPVRMIGGATLSTPYGLDDFAAAQTVIVPSVKKPADPPSAALVGALRHAHDRGARIVSICSGAFALGAAGLLDGRRATTHWLHADLLRRRFPAVTVDPKPLYVDDGDVLTSAGCAAGLDLGLHIVRKDYGARIANAVARRLVIQAHRDGGQAQFIDSPVASGPSDDRVNGTMAWALEHLNEPISVPMLAVKAAMSTRTYLRRFAQCTGTSPMKWLITQRVYASLPLLESSDDSIEQISAAVGFESSVTFRHHFARAMHTTPSAYRRCFNGDAGSRTVPA